MYYVTMTDTFMSGWGEAENKINKLILVCENKDEAQIVFNNASNRGDMEDVEIVNIKPSYPKGKYLTQLKTKEVYPSWYKEGYFKKEVIEYDKQAYYDMLNDLNSRYLHETKFNVTQTLAKYIDKEEMSVFHNMPLGNNKHTVSITSIKSAINSMIYLDTDGLKEKMSHREGEMLKQLEAVTVTDHENGIITINLHSSQLDYTVEVVVSDESHGMKRGLITG